MIILAFAFETEQMISTSRHRRFVVLHKERKFVGLDESRDDTSFVDVLVVILRASSVDAHNVTFAVIRHMREMKIKERNQFLCEWLKINTNKIRSD